MVLHFMRFAILQSFLKEYMECWHKEHDNNTAKAEIDFMRCFRDTWLNFQFQDCIKKLEDMYPEETKKSKEKDFVPNLEETTYYVRWIKMCMDKKNKDLKVRFVFFYESKKFFNIKNLI